MTELNNQAKELLSTVSQTPQTVVNGVVKEATAIGKNVNDAVNSAVQDTTSQLNSMLQNAANAPQKFLNNTSQQINSGLQQLIDPINNTVQGITSGINAATQKVENLPQQVISDLSSQIQSQLTTFLQPVNDITGKMGAFTQNTPMLQQNALNNISSQLSNLLPASAIPNNNLASSVNGLLNNLNPATSGASSATANLASQMLGNAGNIKPGLPPQMMASSAGLNGNAAGGNMGAVGMAALNPAVAFGIGAVAQIASDMISQEAKIATQLMENQNIVDKQMSDLSSRNVSERGDQNRAISRTEAEIRENDQHDIRSREAFSQVQALANAREMSEIRSDYQSQANAQHASNVAERTNLEAIAAANIAIQHKALADQNEVNRLDRIQRENTLTLEYNQNNALIVQQVQQRLEDNKEQFDALLSNQQKFYDDELRQEEEIMQQRISEFEKKMVMYEQDERERLDNFTQSCQLLFKSVEDREYAQLAREMMMLCHQKWTTLTDLNCKSLEAIEAASEKNEMKLRAVAKSHARSMSAQMNKMKMIAEKNENKIMRCSHLERDFKHAMLHFLKDIRVPLRAGVLFYNGLIEKKQLTLRDWKDASDCFENVKKEVEKQPEIPMPIEFKQLMIKYSDNIPAITQEK